MKRLGLTLLALIAADVAAAGEYRVFTLADGRVLVAEVLATEASGLRVRVPQGETYVPFTQLVDMVDVDEAKYREQDDWYVYVAASEMYRSGFVATFEAVPNLRVLGTRGTEGVVRAEQLVKADACGTDIECVVDALTQPAVWYWVVVGELRGSEMVLQGAVTSGGTRTEERAPLMDPDAVRRATYEVIGLVPPPKETVVVVPTPVPSPRPKPVREPREPRAPGVIGRERVTALSFAPVPGMPSLVRKDWAGFGMAVATVVPATAAWVGVSGKVAQSAPQHVALGLGGFYVSTVLANQVFGMRGLHDTPAVAVGPIPTQEGGAGVGVTVIR